MTVYAADWRPELHPRGEHGRWARKPFGKLYPGNPPVTPGESYPGQIAEKVHRELERTALIPVQDRIYTALQMLGDGEYSRAAQVLKDAATSADMQGEPETRSELLDLAAQIETGSAEYTRLGRGFDAAMAKASPAVTKALGGGHQLWDGHVRVTDSNTMGWALADINYQGRVRVSDITARDMLADLDGKGPVTSPSSFTVPLHELIHGVVPAGTNADEWGEHDGADQALEEGFTELGTIAHAPEFFDALGIGDRPTDILAHGREASDHADPVRGNAFAFRLRTMAKVRGQREYALAERAVKADNRAEAERQIKAAAMADTRSTPGEIHDLLASLEDVYSQIPANPDYERRKRDLIGGLSLESSKLHGRAVAPMGGGKPPWPVKANTLYDATQLERLSKAMARAATDLDHDDLDGAREELGGLFHAGDSGLSDDAQRLQYQLAGLVGTPMSKHETMASYARRLQDHARINSGDAWGHYPDETTKANGWVTMAALSQGGLANDSGEEIQRAAFALADEINRASTEDKPKVMARQVLRTIGIADGRVDLGGAVDPASGVAVQGTTLSDYVGRTIHRLWLTEKPEDVWMRAVRDAQQMEHAWGIVPLKVKAAAETPRGKTQTGRAAYRVLAWVNGGGDATEGLAKLAKLGGQAPDTRSLHEVQDVAHIVAGVVSAHD